MKTTVARLVGAVGLVALTTGCSQSMAFDSSAHAAGMAMSAAPTSAAGLKSALNTLFQEHVYLAAAATGAALGGRDEEFKSRRGRPRPELGSDRPSYRLHLWR